MSRRPAYLHQDCFRGIEIRMGPEKERAPGTDGFRYVVVNQPGGKIWQGYIYEENQVNRKVPGSPIRPATEWDRYPNTEALIEQDLAGIRERQGKMSYGEDLDLGSSYIGKHEKAEDDSVGMAARRFMVDCGLSPTPDAASQLAEAFLPALKIMCERGYDPDGGTWRSKGWRGLVHDIMNKTGRLKFHSWFNSRYDRDSAIDLINFAGFYIRMKNLGDPWGDWGEPSATAPAYQHHAAACGPGCPAYDEHHASFEAK